MQENHANNFVECQSRRSVTSLHLYTRVQLNRSTLIHPCPFKGEIDTLRTRDHLLRRHRTTEELPVSTGYILHDETYEVKSGWPD